MSEPRRMGVLSEQELVQLRRDNDATVFPDKLQTRLLDTIDELRAALWHYIEHCPNCDGYHENKCPVCKPLRAALAPEAVKGG